METMWKSHPQVLWIPPIADDHTTGTFNVGILLGEAMRVMQHTGGQLLLAFVTYDADAGGAVHDLGTRTCMVADT